MSDELRGKFTGLTLCEWIDSLRLSVNDGEGYCDAEPFVGIVGNARRSYDLNGAALDAVVRRCLIAMFENGARPIQGSGLELPVTDEMRKWGLTRRTGYVLVTRFGTKPEEMADGIVREWHASGVDPEHDGLWFAHLDWYKTMLHPSSPEWPER